MDPLTLLLLGGTALSGFLSGGKDTSSSTTSTKLSPELQAAFDEILKNVQAAFPTTYPAGAQPTAAYGQLTNMLPGISSAIGAQANQYSGALDSIINRTPARIQIPTMVNGGPTATLSGASFGNGFNTNPLAAVLGGVGGGAGSAGDDNKRSSPAGQGYSIGRAMFDPVTLAQNANGDPTTNAYRLLHGDNSNASGYFDLPSQVTPRPVARG